MKTRTQKTDEIVKALALYIASYQITYTARFIHQLIPFALISLISFLLYQILTKRKIAKNCKKLMVHVTTPEGKQELILEEAILIGNINKQLFICLLGISTALINPVFFNDFSIKISRGMILFWYQIGIRILYGLAFLLSVVLVILFYRLLKILRII